jgi:microcystin degradation protein MlrC
MRVGIVAFLHESNTFATPPTGLDKFQDGLLVTGDEVRRHLEGTHHEVGGFFEGLNQGGATAVPIFAARATPSGTVTSEAFEELCEQLLEALSQAGPIDGLLVAPHGATVSEAYPDADGEWLRRVRKQVGPGLPIIGTLDAHANLSTLMVENTDALTAYRTNPHLDQRERGREAAGLMLRTLRGEIRPVQAAAFPPVVINIERQLTSEPHLRPLYELAAQIRSEPSVLSSSILLGFPYADVEEMGAACVVVADGDRALAERAVARLGGQMWEMREEFVANLVSIPEAIDQALLEPGPVCLLDMGDNVGGGSPADATFLAQELIRRGVSSVCCLYDPAAAAKAFSLGVGALTTFELGGHTDALHGQPILGEFRVRSLHDGEFTELQARHGGIREYHQGPTAVLEHVGGATLMVNSRRTPPFSLRQLTSCGLDPRAYRILAAKGVNAPVAAYQEVCRTLIRVNTPGCTTADVSLLRYSRRRVPLFPLERS